MSEMVAVRRLFIYEKKLHQSLTENKPDSLKEDDWKLLDIQVLFVILLSLHQIVAFNIAKEKIVYILMRAISSMYEKSSTSNKVYLTRRLFASYDRRYANCAT